MSNGVGALLFSLQCCGSARFGVCDIFWSRDMVGFVLALSYRKHIIVYYKEVEPGNQSEQKWECVQMGKGETEDHGIQTE